jgi:hypothetical protein
VADFPVEGFADARRWRAGEAGRAGLAAAFRFGRTRAAGFFFATGREDEVRRCLGMSWSTEKAAPEIRIRDWRR